VDLRRHPRLPLELDGRVPPDEARGIDAPPCTVTAEFTVKRKRPTPIDATLHLAAHVVKLPTIGRRSRPRSTANGK